ncbi:hypothetical protein D3C80_566410 [compost metagenome]
MLASLNVRLQIGHRLFHHAGGFHHLRQEHLAFAEQIADDVHARHQWPFDHFDRAIRPLSGLFGIELDKLGYAFYQRVFQPFFDRPAAPFRLLHCYFIVFAAAVFLRQFQQPFGPVVTTVEDHVFHRIAQLSRQIVVDRQLPGVNDPHVHAVADRVIQEHRVDRFAYRIVAAE